MTELEAIQARHAVRNYLDQPIEKNVISALKQEIDQCNQKQNLHFQLIINEEDAFKSLIPAFGRFKNVKNYIALVAQKQENCYETCGYYGAHIMIKAQQLGLNSCWVISSYNKKKCTAAIASDEELVSVIAIGYGTTSGTPHKSKSLESLCKPSHEEWFMKGMTAAMLAPTGLNRQNFMIEASGNTVSARATDDSAMSRIDLGIVKYHFEIGAGKDNFCYI